MHSDLLWLKLQQPLLVNKSVGAILILLIYSNGAGWM